MLVIECFDGSKTFAECVQRAFAHAGCSALSAFDRRARAVIPSFVAENRTDSFVLEALRLLEPEHTNSFTSAPWDSSRTQHRPVQGLYNVIFNLLHVHHPESSLEEFDALRRCCTSLAHDLNSGLARLMVDRSHEPLTPFTLRAIDTIARDAGVTNDTAVIALSQNRSNPRRTGILRHLVLDYHPVTVGLRCADALVNGLATGERLSLSDDHRPNFDVLCMNSAPRPHRYLTVLALAKEGLIDLVAARTCAQRPGIPFVSLPGFEDQRQPRPPKNAEELTSYCAMSQMNDLVDFVDDLVAVLPLEIDESTQSHQERMTQIDLSRYSNSKISVVTETHLTGDHLRITEKTLRSAALGHPFVTIGCRNSLEVVREFGFSTFDDLIDQTYDSEPSNGLRLRRAVASAREFVQRWDSDEHFRDRVRAESDRNRAWTVHGFAKQYQSRFARPISAFLRCGTDPDSTVSRR